MRRQLPSPFVLSTHTNHDIHKYWTRLSHAHRRKGLLPTSIDTSAQQWLLWQDDLQATIEDYHEEKRQVDYRPLGTFLSR